MSGENHPEAPIDFADLMMAERVCTILERNLQIEFQVRGENMGRDEAQAHFQSRAALVKVRLLLLDEAKSLFGN